MKPEKGMSLLEILITVAILGAAGAILLGIIVASTNLSIKQSSKVEQGLASNDALSAFREGVRSSSSIVAGYPEGVNPTYTSSASQLVLKLPSIDQDHNIINDTFDYLVFYSSNGVLRYEVFPAAQSKRLKERRVFSLSLDNVVFKYYGSANPSVEVEAPVASRVVMMLSQKKKTGADVEVLISTSEASLRND